MISAQPDQTLQTLGLPHEQYDYDAVHNRTSSGHQPGTWSYNGDNQLTQYPYLRPFTPGTQPTDTQVSYTPQGHTSKETSAQWVKDYQYNAAERLIRYATTNPGQSTPQIEASYRYDPFGRRILKSTKIADTTKTTYFVYGEQAMMSETDGGGAVERLFGWSPILTNEETTTWLLDVHYLDAMPLSIDPVEFRSIREKNRRLIAPFRTETWSAEPIWSANLKKSNSASDLSSQYIYGFIFSDVIGTPHLVTSYEGGVLWKGVSEAFGAMAVGQRHIDMNIRFPGQHFDNENGLHQNFYRDYNPATGRYLQFDPLGLEGGLNGYGYSESNPFIWTDPLGLRCTLRQHLGMQLMVNAACKWSGQRECFKSDTCPENTRKISKNSLCATARRLINNRCFNGGDKGHKEAEQNALNAIQWCLKYRPHCCKDEQ